MVRSPDTAWPVAAAVLFGLFLAGTWLPFGTGPATVPSVPRVADGGTRPQADPSRTSPTEAEVPSVAGPTVAIPAGLHRLSPTDPRMRDTAWRFRAPVFPDANEIFAFDENFDEETPPEPVRRHHGRRPPPTTAGPVLIPIRIPSGGGR